MRLKKLLVFLLIFCFTFEAHAGFFGSLIACLTNPCNCFGGDRKEQWGHKEINRGDENKLCPPWNKGGGRNNHTCLVAPEQTYPGNFIPYKQNLCAEETPESNYFEPKIRIRDQECNAIFCWTTENTLIWDGQCKTLAGPYGLPLTRMCARIALPEDPIRDMPADPGYTPKKHLDSKGEMVADKPIYDYEGNEMDVDPPKLCAYLDPAFLGIGASGQPLGIDLFDLNPNHQAFHRTDKLHPVVRIMIFFIDMAAQFATSAPDMMAALANMLGGGGDGGGFFKVIGTFFEAISWLINGFFSLIKEMLKAIGQINRVVSDFKYGCVTIPLAPGPPPFCDKVQPFFQPLVVQKICATKNTGNPGATSNQGALDLCSKAKEDDELCIEDATLETKCVHSSMRNNAIHNSVRAGYEYLVPLCRNGEDPSQTDTCVTIENLDYTASDAMHTMITGRKGILKLCSEAGSNEPCIKASICGVGESSNSENPCIPYECSGNENGCSQGVRLVYGIRNKQKITPMNYYRDDLKACGGTTDSGVLDVMCQEVWGVNLSEFVDLPLVFPKTEGSSGFLGMIPLMNNFSLRDNNGKVNEYSATIVKNHHYNSDLGYTQSPKDICVFKGNKRLYGCVKRGELPKPKVHECSTNYAGLSCDSERLKPQMIVSSSIGSDSVAMVAIPKTVYDDDYDENQPKAITETVINLAGYGFNLFVTDEDDIKIPFSGEREITPITVHGYYEGNQKPADAKGNENRDAIYLKGLEYVNGRYVRGGTKICIDEVDHEKCPIDTTQCVLTKLKNSETVDCEQFKQEITAYPGISVCADDLGDEWKDISKKLLGLSLKRAEIEIGKDEDKYTLTQYCYESPINEALCEVSTLLEDRIDPDDSKLVLDDTDYYNVNFTPPSNQNLSNEGQIMSSLSGMGYDKSKEALRDKTSYEKGLCIKIEKIYCDARDDNNASWPRTAYGEEATGTCKSGFTQKSKPLKRYCLPNDDFKSARFEDLDGEVGCE